VAAEVLQVVDWTGGVEAARTLAREHTAAAVKVLVEKVPDGSCRGAMVEAASSLIERGF
jgi:octaprenyl-diphosphate synthase